MSRNACTELIVHMLFTREKMCQDFLKLFEKYFSPPRARIDMNTRPRATSHDADSKRRDPH